ncbi:hypothetical protein USDA257_c16980 [Sinorhizobium fredii USDA 257]|uniref:Uncharacterized protein n=1 Tax=Sinorhizobium fredii (strain USDA 257) TaxID=1185652 RepID=I3X330_SINF2|nr:hypothetical protein USDA257_c16980 [Sinorhizobium fredii USDA 257]
MAEVIDGRDLRRLPLRGAGGSSGRMKVSRKAARTEEHI